MPSVLLTAQVPLLVAVASFLFFRLLRGGADRAPFLLALGLFLLSFVGLGISIFPDVVPGRITPAWSCGSAAPGSVRQNAAIISPLASFGIHRAFCSTVPYSKSPRMPMELCAPIVTATDAS